MAAAGFLHRHRRWITPLLGVVAAASLAFSVEVLIIDGLTAAGGIFGLVIVGVTASVLLAVITAFDVFAGRRYGVVLHVALLRGRSWRRRHEIEHDLLVAHAQQQSSRATVTTLTIDYTVDGGDPVARTAEALLDSAATGAALLPGAMDLRILAAGDPPSLIALGFVVQPALAQWRSMLLVDRSHEPGEPFLDLELPEARAKRADDIDVLILVGARLDRGPVESYRASASREVRTVEAGHLAETSAAYDSVLRQVADELGTSGAVSVGAGGPAVFGFAAGWLAAQAGAGAMQALEFAQGARAYRPGPATPVVSAEPVRPTPSQGVGPRLLLASSLLAGASTLAFGSVATLLEWGLARSNSDGPFTDWVWLVGVGIALPSALALILLRPWVDRLARPDVRVALQPTDEVGRRGELLVAPRTAKHDPYSCVGWLREAMADIRSFRPGSRVVIDLDTAPQWVLGPLGSYLNRGHRGGDVVLRCAGGTYELHVEDLGAPERVRLVWDGYRTPLRDARLWEVET